METFTDERKGYITNKRGNSKKKQESVSELLNKRQLLKRLGASASRDACCMWKLKLRHSHTLVCSTGHLCPELISLQKWFASGLPPTAKKME